MILVHTTVRLVLIDASTNAIRWNIERNRESLRGAWFTPDDRICHTDGRTIWFHDRVTGESVESQRVLLASTHDGNFTSIDGGLQIATSSSVIDVGTGRLLWSFINRSDHSGTPVLIRWRPSGQLINPEEVAEQVYDLVESQDRPGEVDVLQHREFIKLLPDDLRKSEEAVFE